MKLANTIAVERENLGAMFDHLATVSDPLRCRMLLALERHELTVSELCSVLQLPQSTVSRHLKTLSDAARSGQSRLAWLTDAESKALVGVNPSQVSTVRLSD